MRILHRARAGARPVSGRSPGIASVELLLAAPLMLLLALLVLQVALLVQARQALSHALLEAARAGSVGHSQPDAVRRGLARGLVPFLGGSDSEADHLMKIGAARVHIALGERLGWMRLRQLSPTRASFDDWGGAPPGPGGAPMAGPREIPIDNLPRTVTTRQPATGMAGRVEDMPVGRRSGQTLPDASLLRLELQYGVPVKVPLAGRVLALAVAAWDGCPVLPGPALGLLDLRPVLPSRLEPGRCLLHGVPALGDAPLRIPVRVMETIRMQTPPRLHDAVPVGD